MSYLARMSLANRALVALTTVLVIGFGVYAAGLLNQELIPSRTLPAVSIVSQYEGAPPGIVEREVTEPIEQQVQAGDTAPEEFSSQSKQGISIVQVSYEFGTDTEAVARDLQRRIAGIQGQLPEDVDPEVSAGSFDDLPVVQLAATSPAGQHRLGERLRETVVPELGEVPGVSDVSVTGVPERIVRVTLDPNKLREHGLTSQQVSSALQANETAVPGGDVTGNGETLSIEVGDPFDSASEIRDLPISVSSAGAVTGQAPPSGVTPGLTAAAPAPEPVRLSEVASVRVANADSASITRTGGEPSLGISITKGPDGNTVDISEAVRERVPELEDQLGDGTELTVIFDQAPFIEDSIEGLTTEGLLGLGFAVVIILIFLVSVRSTLVTALSIPLSVLVALIALWGWGFSLNLLTLGGLTIAVGRVVDDSIVVLENIKRHLGYGEEKRGAILTAVREVAGAVTASTLTTVAVFLPIAVVGGIVGQLFRPFSLAVTIALLASLLVSLTIIPVLAYWFLRAPARSARDAARLREEAEARELRSPLQRTYVPIIRWAARHHVVTTFLAVLVFAGSMSLVPQLKTSFIGSAEQNTFTIEQELPAGTSLEATRKATKKVEGLLEQTPEVDTYQVTIGSAEGAFAVFFGAGAGSNTATFSVTTDKEADQDAVRTDLRQRLEDLSNIGDVSVSTPQEGSSGSDLSVTVTAAEEKTLRGAASQVATAVRDIPDTADVTSDLATESPQLQVKLKPEEAAERGLTQSQVAQAISLVTQGIPAAEVILDGESQPVMLRQQGPRSVKPAKLENLEIPAAGGTVELGEVAKVSRVQAPVQISHTGGERSATITATATSENLGAVNADLRAALDDLDLPEGAEYSLGGVTADQRQAFMDLGIALLVAIAIVYLIMVATFRSLIQPLILLVSVPFAATGAVALLLATDTALGISALIGALMLVGIVVTNAIVLLDLINQYRAAGMDAHTAVVEGGRRRLRPVLMTAVATICALTPMALGLTGDGAFISQPLAITVIGGLATSTLLTLILVPALYAMVERVKEGSRQRRDGRHARGGEEDEEALVSLYRDLPDDQAREQFVTTMSGVARDLEHAHAQDFGYPEQAQLSQSGRELPPGNSVYPNG